MKFLRFLLLVALLLVAYLGQLLLDTSLLTDLPFLSTIQQLPGLPALLSLPRTEVINWGAGFLVVAGVIFGLLATAWPRLPATSLFTQKSANGSGSARFGFSALVVGPDFRWFQYGLDRYWPC